MMDIRHRRVFNCINIDKRLLLRAVRIGKTVLYVKEILVHMKHHFMILTRKTSSYTPNQLRINADQKNQHMRNNGKPSAGDNIEDVRLMVWVGWGGLLLEIHKQRRV
jgi:hypothetical protein